MMARYLKVYDEVAQQKRDDYRRASNGEITWRQYVSRWGVA